MGRTGDDIRLLIVDDSEKFLDGFLVWIESQPGGARRGARRRSQWLRDQDRARAQAVARSAFGVRQERGRQSKRTPAHEPQDASVSGRRRVGESIRGLARSR